MRALFPLLVVLLGTTAAGRPQIEARLINSFSETGTSAADSLFLMGPGGPVATSAGGGGASWLGAASLGTSRWATTRRLPTPSVSIFDQRGNAVATFTTPEVADPGDVVYDTIRRELVIVDRSGSLERYSALPPYTYRGTIVSPEFPRPVGIGFDDGSGRIIVSARAMGGASAGVFALTAAGAVVQRTRLPFDPGDVDHDPLVAGGAWTTDRGGRRLVHVTMDGGVGTIGLTIPLPGSGPALAVAVETPGEVWGCTAQGDLRRHDASTGAVLDSLPMPPFTWAATMDLVGPLADVGAPYCSTPANSSGLPATIGAGGSDRATTNFLILSVEDAPNGSFGYFLVAPSAGFVPMAGGSQGTLCLGGAIGRFSTVVLASGLTGTFALLPDLTAVPGPGGPVAVTAGETWYFQCWFRDANPTVTSNYSNGLAVTFR